MKRRNEEKEERGNEKKEGMKGESYTFLILSYHEVMCNTFHTHCRRKDDSFDKKRWHFYDERSDTLLRMICEIFILWLLSPSLSLLFLLSLSLSLFLPFSLSLLSIFN